MKELRNKIMDNILSKIEIDKETMILILNSLETEKQLQDYLDYLESNQVTDKTQLIKKSLQIAGKN